jgi:basic amino acid/polyamine antiporter, APA family
MTERREGRLSRDVAPWMLLVFVIGDMVGGGIYALVGEVGGETGGAIWTAFALALLLATFTAGAYAELVTKYPQAGGAAVFVQRAFGNDFLTFLVGFAVLVSAISSAGALARAFGGDYLSEFVDLPGVLVALVVLGAATAVNLRGIRDSARLNVAFTAIELGGLVLVIIIGLAFILGGDGDPSRAFEFKEGGSSVPALILAGAALAFYALIGFEDSVNLAEEAQQPTRAYPRALFGGLLIAGLVYVAVSMIASMAVPTNDLAESDGPLLEVVQQGPLSVDPKLFAAIALFALANTILINLITASRLLYGMSEEGVLPRWLGLVLPGRHTPWAAIALTAAIAAVLVSTGDLETLADTTVVLLLLAFIGVNAAVLGARRDPVEHAHFRIPTPIPVIGIVVCIGLLTQQEGRIFARAALLLAVGVVLWAVGRAARGASASAPPA